MDLEQLKKLAKDLPAHQPSEERSALMRSGLLAAVEHEELRPKRRSPWFASAVLVSVAAALAFYAGTRQTKQAPASADNALKTPPLISPFEGASFEEMTVVEDGAQVKELRLHDGRLEVSGTTASTRVRVRMDNAEVVGVARFALRAKGEKLQEIRVTSGSVSLRIVDHPPIQLGPGESWAIPVEEKIELAVAPVGAFEKVTANDGEDVEQATERAPPKKPRLKTKVSVTAEVTQESTETETETETETNTDTEVVPTENQVPQATLAELAFASGYRAVKRGDFADALFDLDRAIENSSGALQIDARYWRIVALARGGRLAPALTAMEEFVQQHPRSSRGGEVATMLGWAYLERGETKKAKPLFLRGEKDASKRVRSSAKAGLQTLANSQTK